MTCFVFYWSPFSMRPNDVLRIIRRQINICSYSKRVHGFLCLREPCVFAGGYNQGYGGGGQGYDYYNQGYGTGYDYNQGYGGGGGGYDYNSYYNNQGSGWGGYGGGQGYGNYGNGGG